MPYTFCYNVADATDTAVSSVSVQSFVTALLSLSATVLKKNEECMFILFSIAAWLCVASEHVPYLLLQRHGHGRLVPFSIFCYNHILLSHNSVEEERGESNFTLFSITRWNSVAFGQECPYLSILQRGTV